MAITVENLYKSYGDKKVLTNFSHNFESNSTTALMGASGCGKTTLLMILLGLVPFDKGSIKGIDHKKTVAVFQEDRLCENLSPLYNLKFVAQKGTSPQALIDLLIEAGLCLKDIHQPVRELSGGMKRRVAIVRALCVPFDLVVMDEPFQGLDENTKKQMIALIKKHTHGKQGIYVTHDVRDALALGANIVNLKGLLA